MLLHRKTFIQHLIAPKKNKTAYDRNLWSCRKSKPETGIMPCSSERYPFFSRKINLFPTAIFSYGDINLFPADLKCTFSYGLSGRANVPQRISPATTIRSPPILPKIGKTVVWIHERH